MRPDTFLWDRTGLCVPNLARTLGDGAVAGEFLGAGDVQDGFARPPLAVRIELAEPPVRVEIGLQVRQMHIVVALRQQRPVYIGVKTPGS